MDSVLSRQHTVNRLGLGLCASYGLVSTLPHKIDRQGFLIKDYIREVRNYKGTPMSTIDAPLVSLNPRTLYLP